MVPKNNIDTHPPIQEGELDPSETVVLSLLRHIHS